jgi:monoamine oxidase
MHFERPIQEYVDIVKQGIVKKFEAEKLKKVIIVGAGLAGLSAGYELKRAGHTPVILEAQQRVGGRVYTLRDPFTEGLYAEVGAMRIPRAHSLTMAYIEKFGLKTDDFTMDNSNAYYYIGGHKMRASEAHADPSLMGFEVAPNEVGKTSGQMYMQALQPLLDMLEKEGDAAWEEIVAKYDQYSTREFLELNGWSEGMIEMFGLLANQESVMNSSFLELFREDSGNYYTNMIEIQGGTDRLPHAFLPELKDNIRFGAKMIAMDQSPDGVTIHYQTHAGKFTESGDYAIITVPFPVLRHVEVLKPFSRAEEPRHPSVALRCIGEDTVPVQAPLLGGGRRHLRRRHDHRPAHPQPVLSRPRARDRPRRDPCQLHLVGGRPALGFAQAG